MEKNYTRKIIGVLGLPAVDDENDGIIALYKDYNNAIVKKECIPLMISPLTNIDYVNTKRIDIPDLTQQEKDFYKDIVDICDGIIIPGGYRWYNFQEFIVEYAIEKDIPVLGICMGMQLLASLDNGGNFNELNETNIEHRQANTKYVHDVDIVKDTKLNKILETKKIKVNSKHRYHITRVNKYKIAAYSEDGLIEAIEHPDKKFVIGIQWHPEKMFEYDIYANKIIDEFINQM